MKIVVVAGTRPNFVKVAPLLEAMNRHPKMEAVLVHTGQHYSREMSKQFFDDLSIQRPVSHLDVGSGSHAEQTARILLRLDQVLPALNPRVVLVVGDVNSTLAAALTAAGRRIPIAHVEAGLRSFDRSMPEELNRILTDAMSDLLFATEESGVNNLVRESVPHDRIHLVGNVMIDALQHTRRRWRQSRVFDRLGLRADRPYAVLTLHRPSNVDDPTTLKGLLGAVSDLIRYMPVILPVHPRVRPKLATHGHIIWAGPVRRPPARGLVCTPPQGYLDFIALLSRAKLVLTDSGGVQEETTALGVRCLTLRDSTERPITVKLGTNSLAGTDQRGVRQAIESALARPVLGTLPPLWDGRASQRIVKVLAEWRPAHQQVRRAQ